ncbi:PREDICTED: lymphatic vessel endothelial hyaluronic acid receptor 1 [Nanorana parkeri]|uniref:lymphatic vessel endothelial hyaluronic acid receptor 1 n=1 Tax=Nanorana parkeri TaxID=125878 RepID=UPI000854040A|nr:PREDICTED: lymphatic vessel endothelial hyaluronic acid receptor 1 [Nanorana parkeri]
MTHLDGKMVNLREKCSNVLSCRIAGVVLVDKKFNYTMAETVCEALGLQIASRPNIAKARDFGFETCSYGWVVEKYGVIPRIQNNEKCGRNLTGVLTWTVPPTHEFSVYCFNSSDLRINSCKPGLMVTIAPSTASPTTDSPPPPTTQPRVTDPQGRTTGWPILPTTSRESTSRPHSSTLITTLKTTPKVVPPTTTPKTTTPPLTEEPTNPPENQAARQSERIVFGKLPTALLILAVVFFIAAVVLAICYIRKYKTSVFFSKIKVEKESVETKVLRETADATKEEEITPNGREEKPQNLQANTSNSMEAEV